MHITLLALGSRGDILPLVALGRGLRHAGYQVRLVSFQDFASIANENGIDFHSVDIDSRQVMSSAAGLDLAESGGNPIKMLISIMRSFGSITKYYEKAFADTRIWNTDAIVNQIPAGMYGIDLAEKLDLPYFTAAVIPLHPTGAFPIPLLTTHSLGRQLNRFTYRLGWQMGWQPMRAAINRFRVKSLKLKPAPLSGYDQLIRSKPTLNGFSSFVVPRPDDWRANVHITGYWFPQQSSWNPSPEILQFLRSGKPPIFIGFGSMPVRNPEVTSQVILSACRRAGVRVVIGSGWSALGWNKLPDFAFQLDYAPYQWLFPKMAGIVHHGGSGTTALALKSGKPSFIVPFGADQFFWGTRTHALSVGPSPLPFKNLEVNILADKLKALVGTPSYNNYTSLISSQLKSEHGIARAVEIIQNYL